MSDSKTIKLPPDIHRILKNAAVEAGVSMVELLRRVADVLARNQGKALEQTLLEMPITDEDVTPETLASIKRGVAQAKRGDVEDWSPRRQ